MNICQLSCPSRIGERKIGSPYDSHSTDTETETLVALQTGITTHDLIRAIRFKQGGRTVYSFTVSPDELTYLVSEPDPDVPVESNREIRPKHAEEFGEYFANTPTWIIPSILLRTRKPLEFEIESEEGNSAFGAIKIPRGSNFEVYTLDGQHRTLGFFMAKRRLSSERESAVEALYAAKRTYPGTASERLAQERLDAINASIKRFQDERIAIQLYVEADPQSYRQMFFDIADNALGITAAVRARFDSRKAVNRALPEILEHPLIKTRHERERDSVKMSSPNFLTIKEIADMAKNVVKGYYGRMSRGDNLTMDEHMIATTTKEFLDDLIEAFQPLKSLELGHITPQQLRETSLLGAPRFLRILSGVYYNLRSPLHGNRRREDVVKFMRLLAPHVSSDGNPVYPGSIWLERFEEGTFIEGENDVTTNVPLVTKALHEITEWEVLPPDFLLAPPAPRPQPEAAEGFESDEL